MFFVDQRQIKLVARGLMQLLLEVKEDGKIKIIKTIKESMGNDGKRYKEPLVLIMQ